MLKNFRHPYLLQPKHFFLYIVCCDNFRIKHGRLSLLINIALDMLFNKVSGLENEILYNLSNVHIRP